MDTKKVLIKVCELCGSSKTSNGTWYGVRTGNTYCNKCYQRNLANKNRPLYRNRCKAYRDNNLEVFKKRENAYRKTVKARFSTLNQQLNKRGLAVTITFEQYSELIKNLCYYCEGPLPQTGHGLDRLDNNKGYDLSNVVPCCGSCNKIKQDILTPEEMKAAMKAVKQVRLDKILVEGKINA